MSLEFSLNQAPPASASVDCVVVGAFADGSLSAAAAALEELVEFGHDVGLPFL